jgi:hypothetical protein
MGDTSSILAGMRDRFDQLQRIADLAHNHEIRTLVLQVASHLEADMRRLEAEARSNETKPKILPSLSVGRTNLG